jgi:translocation and assembly module TamB
MLIDVPWDRWQDGQVELRLDELIVERGDQTLSNLQPVVLVAGSEAIVVRSLYLGESDGKSEAFFAGRIETGSRAHVDLNVQASLSSEWFQPWLPGIEIKGGGFEVIGKISGPTERLAMNGQGELRDARALVEGFPSSLDHIQGMVLFYPDRVVLDDATAEIAGGRVRAGGAIGIESDGGMPYRFQISGTDLSFRYPEGWLIHGDTELTLASTPVGRQISGIARLDSARYVEDVQLIRSLFERQRLEAGDLEPWRSETQLNLVVELADGLRIQNNLADISGGAELGLRGSLARPVLFGTVELDQGGRLTYSGQEYTVERGLLNFTNPFRVEPVLDLVASTRMREFEVTLSLSGTPERLQTEFVSNPPLAELEVLALLTGGRDPGSRSVDRAEADIDGGAAESFLYGQATSLIAGRFNRLFGLDQFRIDPLTSATGDLSSARVTVGKQLSRDLFVTYSYDPSETEEQILELEWSLSRSLVLVLTQNGDGTYAVDARWEKAL